MSGSALPALRGAVSSVLEGDGELAAMVSGIFSAPPASPTYPYVLFGKMRETDQRTFSRGGLVSTLTIEVVSQAAGDDELIAVYGRIKELLDQAQPAPAGFTAVQWRTWLHRTHVDPDGLTRRGCARVQVTTQETVA